MTEIRLGGSPKTVSELAKRIVRICKTAKCKHRKGRLRRLAEASVFMELNVYAVQELRKVNSKKVKVEVI